MEIPKKECLHISQVLEQAQQALKSRNSLQLKELSNQTVHDSCHYQDEASITIAVLLYAFSKIIERSDFNKIKKWDLFVKKFNAILSLAVKAINENNFEAYQNYVQQARKSLESHSINIKPYIQDVLRKAAINKGSKVYSHGLSLERTSKLLGVSQWALSEYIRAKMAMEFFE
ncbi:hypothetical protein J4462_05115 [Candidatus Pacearchaeota archaeon]|nr:hypothetical protein [Candidatus Pacearchaeota archaeon]